MGALEITGPKKLPSRSPWPGANVRIGVPTFGTGPRQGGLGLGPQAGVVGLVVDVLGQAGVEPGRRQRLSDERAVSPTQLLAAALDVDPRAERGVERGDGVVAVLGAHLVGHAQRAQPGLVHGLRISGDALLVLVEDYSEMNRQSTV